MDLHVAGGHGLSQYLETGCPNSGFIDFCVSKVWYMVHACQTIYVSFKCEWVKNPF